MGKKKKNVLREIRNLPCKNQVSNYGKINHIDLFKNSTPLDKNTKITSDILLEFALLFVPKDILNDFVDFQYRAQNDDVPEHIRSDYPVNYPRDFMELNWHEPTADWISDFIFESDWCKGFSQLQLENALHNIRKAIVIFGRMHPEPYCDEDECEAFDEWKKRLLEANSRLPKHFQESFDNSWIPLHPRFVDGFSP